jgi:hypothetical protein
MTQGRIEDFYVVAKLAEKSVVKFLVKNEGQPEENACTVCAEIPNEALQYQMITPGSSIGWKDPKVYIEIEGTRLEFEKIGDVMIDDGVFYNYLKGAQHG